MQFKNQSLKQLYKNQLSEDYEKLWELIKNKNEVIVYLKDSGRVTDLKNIYFFKYLTDAKDPDFWKDFFVKCCKKDNLAYIMPLPF